MKPFAMAWAILPPPRNPILCIFLNDSTINTSNKNTIKTTQATIECKRLLNMRERWDGVHTAYCLVQLSSWICKMISTFFNHEEKLWVRTCAAGCRLEWIFICSAWNVCLYFCFLFFSFFCCSLFTTDNERCISDRKSVLIYDLYGLRLVQVYSLLLSVVVVVVVVIPF